MRKMIGMIGLLVLGLTLWPVQASQETPLLIYGLAEGGGFGFTGGTLQGEAEPVPQPGFWWWNTEQAWPAEICADQAINSGIVKSEAWGMLAYRAESPLWIEYLEDNLPTSGGNFPDDIRLCHIGTGEVTTIAAQPEGAFFRSENEIDSNYVSRSEPSWSPDGSKVVWSEYYTATNTVQLVSYDLTTEETSIVVEDLLRDQLGGIVMTVGVAWSEAGIGVGNFDAFEVYTESGEMLSSFQFPERSYFEFWITYEDKIYYSYYVENNWWLVDPLTGIEQPMPGIPELYSVAHPDGLTVRYEANGFGDRLWSVWDGAALLPLGIEGDYFRPNPPRNAWIAFSSGGERIVYVKDDQLWQWREGEVSLADGMQNLTLEFVNEDSRPSLLWMPLAWRVAE